MNSKFLILSILLFSGTLTGQEECKVSKNTKVRYAIVDKHVSTIEGSRTLFLFIALGGNDFTDENLRNVAWRIKEIYCKENTINLVMLDKSDKRKFDDLTPPPIFPSSTRALYYLVRDKNIEQLRHYKDGKETFYIRIVDK